MELKTKITKWDLIKLQSFCTAKEIQNKVKRQPMEFSRQNTGVGRLSLLQGNLPNPGIKPRSPTLQTDSLPAEPQGKSKNTGVGSLSFLQSIFLIQELNQGLLHCRPILYQVSYQEALRMGENNSKWNNWQRINFKNIQVAHTGQNQKNKQPNQKKWAKDLNKQLS